MNTAPVREVLLHVVKNIVHPAHVPLEMKAKSPKSRRHCHHRVGAAFLCSRKCSREVHAYHGVKIPDELHRVQIDIPAFPVQSEGALIRLAKVEIEHTGHSVHPQSVSVVLVHPEHGVGKKEALHFAPRKIEFIGSPIRVYLAFVKHLAAKGSETVFIRTEMTRNPVQYHTDSRSVKTVDEIHQIGRSPVS